MNHYNGILCPDGTGYKTLEPLQNLGAIALHGLGMLAEDLGAPITRKARRKARRQDRRLRRKSQGQKVKSMVKPAAMSVVPSVSTSIAPNVSTSIAPNVSTSIAPLPDTPNTTPASDVIAEELIFDEADKSSNTLLYVGIGVAVLLLGSGAFFVTKKRRRAKSLKKAIPSAKPMQQLLNPRG